LHFMTASRILGLYGSFATSTPKRLAKKGQNGYSSSVSSPNSSPCLDRKFKHCEKKYVEKSKAGQTSKANETITTKSLGTISGKRRVG
jgi:hypothetical protein